MVNKFECNKDICFDCIKDFNHIILYKIKKNWKNVSCIPEQYFTKLVWLCNQVLYKWLKTCILTFIEQL